MIRPPPTATRTATLFPYTTLRRSPRRIRLACGGDRQIQLGRAGIGRLGKRLAGRRVDDGDGAGRGDRLSADRHRVDRCVACSDAHASRSSAVLCPSAVGLYYLMVIDKTASREAPALTAPASQFANWRNCVSELSAPPAPAASHHASAAPLDPLFNPRPIALVGATERSEGSSE